MVEFDKDLVKEFWRDRAMSGRTRWTHDSFMNFEVDRLRPLVSSGARILDLGSGYGELSRSLCPEDGLLIAVDQEPLYESGFRDHPHFSFVCSDVLSYSSEERFDLSLLFGVVTHLSRSEEYILYEKIKTLMDKGGVACVKNQCSDQEEFTVDHLSGNLGVRYQGRYPSITEQRDRLRDVFGRVNVIEYPISLKTWENSSHVLFICSDLD